jgi:membrane fusion protein, multidrug efflux system
VLGLRNISLGALVEPGDLITTLDDDRTMKLDFAVPSVFLADLRPGLAIEARSRLRRTGLRGHGERLDSRVDPVTRSVQVRALIPNPEGRSARAADEGGAAAQPPQALVVPEAALLPRAGTTS